MKMRSKSFFVMGVTFILMSALWFFRNRNLFIGSVWLAVGIGEVLIGMIVRAKDKKNQ